MMPIGMPKSLLFSGNSLLETLQAVEQWLVKNDSKVIPQGILTMQPSGTLSNARWLLVFYYWNAAGVE